MLSGHIIITGEPKGNVQPRIAVEKHSARHVPVGESVILACVAQGWPVPTYRYDSIVCIQVRIMSYPFVE
jgi:hypothetical protein